MGKKNKYGHPHACCMNHSEREGVIVRTSLIGILTNIGLAAVKAVIGLLSNSIAVLAFGIDRGEAVETLCSEISAEYPDYTLSVTPDVDVSD